MTELPSNPQDLRVPDPGIRALFKTDSRWQAWLDVEVALAKAQAKIGMIPSNAAEEISKKADLSLFDRQKLADGFLRSGHTLTPLIWELDRLCEGDAGGYAHWGATTQNIVQTGDLLILRKADAIFRKQLSELLFVMADLAEQHAETTMAARTHGQHAVPTTFGAKVAVWLDEISRHGIRLLEASPRVFRAMLGGAAGTLASFGSDGFKLQEVFAAELQMTAMAVPSRAEGDHLSEYVLLLGLMAATTGKIAREIYTLQKQEFGELEEPTPEGSVGSSTMPQKRNPFMAQDIVALSSEIRMQVPLALEAMQTEHEADRATSLQIRQATERACVATGDMLARMKIIISGLSVKPERMRQNLDLTGGLIMAEPVMLALGSSIGRQEAHDIVYDAAQAATLGQKSFADLLGADQRISEKLSKNDIKNLLNPLSYVGLSPELARRAASSARDTATKLLS
ncbi:MAG: class-II fumarase/aspartase family protein [Alphaproteobacteria bacterium]